jgi:hypothetical protein
MIEFIESPIFDNWLKKHIPKKKLVICSPYIKQEALDRVFRLYDVENRCADLDVQILIRGAAREFTINKSSDISILDSIIALEDFNVENFKRVENLHMKAYLVDDSDLLITSGNLTNSGMFVFSGKENFEGGIATDDAKVIARFKEYFADIWNQGEKLSEFYEALLKEYSAYIAQDYSDRETVRRIKRKRYRFKIKTQLAVTAAKNFGEVNTEAEVSLEYDLNDLPPVGKVEYIDDTLRIIWKNEGLSYIQLGEKLRKEFGYEISEDEEKELVNNQKYGEEKSKFLEYLGLARIEKTQRPYRIVINNLGKEYLNEGEENRKKYLKDQIFSKEAIEDILRRCPEESLSLKEYLVKYYNAFSESTLDRKRAAVNNLFTQTSHMNKCLCTLKIQ